MQIASNILMQRNHRSDTSSMWHSWLSYGFEMQIIFFEFGMQQFGNESCLT